ncbi:helix-turn-helix domain-containing protein [Streptomyces sp. NPDC048182]|uniref:helix-turn-helix domain-containing protein n=1 Tax=Streptomyces sp. NPDC048182 TaxID=3365507 RepID=UPI00371D0CF0
MANQTVSVDDPAKSKLTRGLSVLTSFRPGETGLTLSDIARRTGLPKPTAHRLIKELVDSGFLQRRGRQLCLGALLARLGAEVAPEQHLLRAAEPRLLALRRTVRAGLYVMAHTTSSAPMSPATVAAYEPALSRAALAQRRLAGARAAERAFAAAGRATTPDGPVPVHAEGADLVSVCLPLSAGPRTGTTLLVLVGSRLELPPAAVRRAAATARAIHREVHESGRRATYEQPA